MAASPKHPWEITLLERAAGHCRKELLPPKSRHAPESCGCHQWEPQVGCQTGESLQWFATPGHSGGGSTCPCASILLSEEEKSHFPLGDLVGDPAAQGGVPAGLSHHLGFRFLLKESLREKGLPL